MSDSGFNLKKCDRLQMAITLPHSTASQNSDQGKWFFLCAFIFSCFFFWWIRSFLFRFVFHMVDTVQDETIEVSIVALVLFMIGYLVPMSGRSTRPFSARSLDACGDFAYFATKLVAVPAIAIAMYLAYSRAGANSFVDVPLSGIDQAVLYTHLFFGYMFLGAVDPHKQGWRGVWTATILLTLPRLFISLLGGRFFLAQAVVPVVLIAIARGWFRFSGKRILQVAALAVFIIYVPAMTRGDVSVGTDVGLGIFMHSNVLALYQDNTDISLNDNCPPLLISLTAKVIPYSALGVCVIDFGGHTNTPATLERILTNNEPGSFHGTASGTGSNYLLELFVTGGLTAVYLGSAIFGFTCRRFVGWIGMRSLFAGIWAECLTRALFTPRGNLGYVYERIPSLVLATLLVIFIVWAGGLLKKKDAIISGGACSA
jgi:hypothetical protein